MSFWENFGDIIWWFICAFIFISYLYALFAVMSDLFRDHQLSGWAKAVWMVLLVFVPFVTVLAYLIARGTGMAERSIEAADRHREASEAYIRKVAAVSPSEEISRAKALLDSGTISADEFESIKVRLLV